MGAMEQFNNMHKRRFERFRIEQYGLDCEVAGKGPAKFRDISIGGAGIYSSQRLEIGSKCMLGVNTSAGRFKVIANIVWTSSETALSRGEEDYPVSIGLRFDNESMESSKDLVFAVLNSK